MTTRQLGLLFLLSGGSALIYQVAWQRILFAVLGSNIESVTIIVSIFMFGLGMGALLGGKLSKLSHRHLLSVFLFLELCIGGFGFISRPLILSVSDFAMTLSYGALPFFIYVLIALPTLCMGATLPVLVTYLYRGKSVGDIVSKLYYYNTIGSALFCLMSVLLLFRFFDLSTCIYLAAVINLFVGFSIYSLGRYYHHKELT